MPSKHELKTKDLRCICDPRVFSFRNTSELKPLDKVIGQERAVQAIEFGLNMKSKGYNIFVTGLEGTGKSTIVKDLVTAYARKQPTPSDWCLVNNFKDEFRPRAFEVPPGKGVIFAKHMSKLIEDLKKELPKALESDSYLRKLDSLKKKYSDQQNRYLKKMEKFAADRQLLVDMSEGDFKIIPLIDGQPIDTIEDIQLTEKQQSKIEKNLDATKDQIELLSREIDKLNLALHTEIEKLLDSVALSVVQWRVDRIRDDFKDCDAIQEHLDGVEQDIIENFNLFIPSAADADQKPEDWMAAQRATLRQYQVNVLVESTPRKGAPVIIESNPTYLNLIGRIEKRAFMGTVNTDFTMVQAGSLLNANGGYLIMEIEPLLNNPYAWEALKRGLQTKCLIIEDIAEETGFGITALRPEPIPFETKVVLHGSYEAFEILQNYDLRFNKIFKVRADFDEEVVRTKETVQLYARFIARVCKEEDLLPFTPTGVASIVEYGEKHVSDKDKLSLRFGSLLGVLKESDYWARKNNARVISDKYVIRAFREHRFRYNLYEQKIHESYKDNSIMIDVAGEVVGQINGLAVYQIGEFAFGRPVRITAEAYMGKKGIINIEREADMSGRTHNKGVLILSGYLGRTFAQKHPLNLSISITFEQSYNDIDGDSASAAELFAILSSLSGIPIKQGIAVTGSVNQKGQIQAIGGVNQKVEGFYEVCLEKGLNGEQGAIIPSANVKNLMLRREVIKAVRQKKFHVWAVSTVAEGIEILTGASAGKPDQNDNYPEDTIYKAVQQKLKLYMEQSIQLQKELSGRSSNELKS